MKKIRRIISMMLALALLGSTAVFPTFADAKYTTEATADGWTKVINDNGVILGYTEGSGVTIIENDGYAFKDLNRNGKLDAYEDWRLDADDRATDLAAHLSNEQIAGLMLLAFDFNIGTGEFGESGIENLDKGIRSLCFYGSAALKSSYLNAAQAYAEQAAFGIPVEIESEPGVITYWPSNLSMGATFDPDLIAAMGRYNSVELRAQGVTSLNGPQMDIATEPRWSRITGTYGEDPKLSMDMAAAYVNGLQSSYNEDGNDLGWCQDSINAIIKHFPGDGAAEGGRESHYAYGAYNVMPGDNFYTLLLPFQASLNLEGKTGAASGVMPSYSVTVDENGEGLAGEATGSGYNYYKITELLRGEMGFDGITVTDYEIPTLRPYGVEDLTIAERFLKIIEAGNDKVGASADIDSMLEAIQLYQEKNGEEATRERMLQSGVRILRNMFRIGLFENAYREASFVREHVGQKEAVEAAKEAQVKSIVMLKNKDGVIRESNGEKPTVYIPMVYTASSVSGRGTVTPAQWSLPLDAKTASKYVNIVTDKLSDTKTGPADADGNATWSSNDIVRASDEEVVACDFALVMIKSPVNEGGGYVKETGTYIPISLQYRPYTANSIYVREQSIAGDQMVVTVDSTYGAQTITTIENRSYFGQTSNVTNEGDLDLVLSTAEKCKNVVVMITAQNPMVFSEFESSVGTILMNFGGVSDDAILQVVTGKVEPSGLLPLQMPANMDTVEAQYEDVPRDMECHVDTEGNTYDFAFGLNWSGVINDDRVATYGVEPLCG